MIRTCALICTLCLLMIFMSCEKGDEGATPGTDEPAVSGFTQANTPVFESPFNLAGDPSIIRVGETIHMYYSAEEITEEERIFGLVISEDNGQTWTTPDGNNQRDYPVFFSQPDGWDNTLETVEVLKVGEEFWMYYSGYREGEADNTHVENYEIGLATSSDGLSFTRHPNSVDVPLIPRTTSNDHTDDRHAMTSPGVVYENGQFYMIYAGWNVTDDWKGPNAGIRILGATSSDGVNWTKLSNPIIRPAEVTYSEDINEATLMKSGNEWYIPFSTGSSIGIARSSSFTGSYDIYAGPIAIADALTWATEVTAPDGLIEDGKIKLWYHGVSEPTFWPWVIGYSESEFPIEWQ
jgi:predicted GH43/DUF377 family glycosyl hydrolase